MTLKKMEEAELGEGRYGPKPVGDVLAHYTSGKYAGNPLRITSGLGGGSCDGGVPSVWPL
jgi:hypothetical protein